MTPRRTLLVRDPPPVTIEIREPSTHALQFAPVDTIDDPARRDRLAAANGVDLVKRKWTRIAHTRRQYREWLAPVLPGRIFACIPQWLDMSIFGVDEEGQPRTKIMRDAEFKAILVADEQIARFRRELEVENLERLYAARKPVEQGPAARAIWQLGQPRKPLAGHRKAKKSRSIKQRAA